MEIILGATYQDVVTGFTGVCTGRVEYLTGCNQALLIPKVSKDGSSRDGNWFDNDRLKKLKRPLVKINITSNGPDMPAPIR